MPNEEINGEHALMAKLLDDAHDIYLKKQDGIDIFKDVCNGTAYTSVAYVGGSLTVTRIDPKDVVMCCDSKGD